MKKTNNIEQHLDYLRKKCNGDYSLYTGKTGISFCYFLLAQKYNQERNRSIAIQLINDVMNNFELIDSFSFSKGLLGIGWGLEAISQNQYLKLDTDSILYDFDDLIYQQSCFIKSTSLSLDHGCLGKGLYFYLRVKSSINKHISFRNLLNRECLYVLINDIKALLLDDNIGLLREGQNNTKKEIVLITQILLFLYKIYEIEIMKDIVINIIKNILAYIETFFMSNNIIYPHHLYLINAYIKIARQARSEKMKNNAAIWLNEYNKKEFDEKIYNSIEKNIIINLNKYNTPSINNTTHLELIDLFNILNDKQAPISWEQAWLIG